MSPKKSIANLGNVIGYTFPRLHETKEWYVDFQALDPETGTLKRKKYYITKSTKRQMRAAAAALIERLGIKLRQGWTPWETSNNQRGTKLLEDIIKKFLSDTEATSRKTTLENYRSRINILRQYIIYRSTFASYWFYSIGIRRFSIHRFLVGVFVTINRICDNGNFIWYSK